MKTWHGVLLAGVCSLLAAGMTGLVLGMGDPREGEVVEGPRATVELLRAVRSLEAAIAGLRPAPDPASRPVTPIHTAGYADKLRLDRVVEVVEKVAARLEAVGRTLVPSPSDPGPRELGNDDPRRRFKTEKDATNALLLWRPAEFLKRFRRPDYVHAGQGGGMWWEYPWGTASFVGGYLARVDLKS